MGDPAETPLSVRVVRSIADAQGEDPTDLGFRLGDVIETDALNAMDEHERDGWTLVFEVESHEVTVAPDEPVMVDGTPYR